MSFVQARVPCGASPVAVARSSQKARPSSRAVARVAAPLRARTQRSAASSSRRATITASMPGGDKGGLRREDEPKEFWTSEAEKEGKSPIEDPLAIIGLVGLAVPFVLLGIFIATGVIDLNTGY